VRRSAPRRTKIAPPTRAPTTRLGDCLPNAGKTRGLRTRSDFYSDLLSRIKPIGVFYAYAETLRALKVEPFRPNYGFYGPQQPAAASDQPSNVSDLVVRSDSRLVVLHNAGRDEKSARGAKPRSTLEIIGSGDRHGFTVTVRVGGLGSLTPLLSTTVNDITYVPAFGNTIAPGLGTELDSGVPSGKNHEYFCTEPSGSLTVPAKLTAWPHRNGYVTGRRGNRSLGG
jgi:hypothetical protein